MRILLFRYGFISLCNGEEEQKEKVTNELITISDKMPIVSTELSINRLLPIEQRNKVKYTFNYRVNDNDILYFSEEIEEFLRRIQA